MVNLTVLFQIENNIENTNVISKNLLKIPINNLETFILLQNDFKKEKELTKVMAGSPIKIISSKEDYLNYVLKENENKYVAIIDQNFEVNENIIEKISEIVNDNEMNFLIYKSENDFIKVIKKEILKEYYLIYENIEQAYLNLLNTSDDGLYIDKEDLKTINISKIEDIKHTFKTTCEKIINIKLDLFKNEYEKSTLDFKKNIFLILQNEFIKMLKEDDAEKTVLLLSYDNRKFFEQIIISETVEEYELFKKIVGNKQVIQEIKENEKELEKQNVDLINFNNKLLSSKSWKLTKFLRIKDKI